VLNTIRLKIMEFLGVKELGPVFSVMCGLLFNLIVILIMFITNRMLGCSNAEIVVLVFTELIVFIATCTALQFNINFYLDKVYYAKYGQDARVRKW